MTTEILVCVLCRPAGVSRELPRAGRALYDEVNAAVLRADLPFLVRTVDFMSGCSRACTVALHAPGKYSYFFGDLPPDSTSAGEIVACAQLHRQSTDGLLPRQARPDRLREGILARLPATLGTP